MADTYSKFVGDSETEHTEPDNLATAMARGSKHIETTASAGDTAQPLDSKAAQYYLDQIRTANERYAPTATPESKKSLASALDRAEQLYRDQASKNEWLEVAQMLGRAGTQFAAAQSGMSSGGERGRNMSNLDFGPGIDYGARTERAGRDFAQTSRNLGELESLSQRDYATREKANEAAGKRSSEAPEKGLSAALREEEIRRREKADAVSADRAEKATTAREDKSLRAQQLRDLEGQERDLASKLRARQTLSNMLQQEGDLSGKSVHKLQEKYGAIAAQGDVDLSALQTELSTAKKPMTVMGIETPLNTEDPEKQNSILGQKTAEIRNLLDEVRAQKARLLQGKPAPGDMPKQVAPPAPSTGKIRVIRKADGKSGTLDPADFDPEKYTKVD